MCSRLSVLPRHKTQNSYNGLQAYSSWHPVTFFLFLWHSPPWVSIQPSSLYTSCSFCLGRFFFQKSSWLPSSTPNLYSNVAVSRDPPWSLDLKVHLHPPPPSFLISLILWYTPPILSILEHTPYIYYFPTRMFKCNNCKNFCLFYPLTSSVTKIITGK